MKFTLKLHPNQPILSVNAPALPLVNNCVTNSNSHVDTRSASFDSCAREPGTESNASVTGLGWRSDSELWRVFDQECQERLAAVELDLKRLDENPSDLESLASLLRAFHTIKAGSSLLEAPLLSQSAHELETLLDWFHVHRAPVDPAVVQAVRSASAILKQSIARMLQGPVGDGNCTNSAEQSASQVTLGQLIRRFVPGAERAARRLGKDVNVQVEAGEIRVGRDAERALNEALPHLLLNAIAHGIEPPDQRTMGGKSACGNVWVRAEERENRLVIEVADDGAGVDHAQVLEAAIQRGLVHPQAAIADQAALELIFAPGCSTVPLVSTIAGRGTGLEAARDSVKRAGGSIRATSLSGKGASFFMELPVAGRLSPT